MRRAHSPERSFVPRARYESSRFILTPVRIDDGPVSKYYVGDPDVIYREMVFDLLHNFRTEILVDTEHEYFKLWFFDLYTKAGGQLPTMDLEPLIRLGRFEMKYGKEIIILADRHDYLEGLYDPPNQEMIDISNRSDQIYSEAKYPMGQHEQDQNDTDYILSEVRPYYVAMDDQVLSRMIQLMTLDDISFLLKHLRVDLPDGSTSFTVYELGNENFELKI